MIKFDDTNQIKDEIKKITAEIGMSQRELATQMGMLPQTFTSLVNKKNFSFADLKRICETMDCSLFIDIVRNKDITQRLLEQEYNQAEEPEKNDSLNSLYTMAERLNCDIDITLTDRATGRKFTICEKNSNTR